jgi:hypothetical protein
MLAGFGLTNIPEVGFISTGIAEFFSVVGALAMIVFGLALLYLGVKAFFNEQFK